MSRTIAVADVGGTHARFALAEVEAGRVISMGEPVTLKTAEQDSFQAAWQQFGKVAGVGLPRELSMAFAGPVGGELLKLTNNAWVIQPALIEEQMGVSRYNIVNDFGAMAHAVAQLGPEHFDHLCGPEGSLPEQGVTSVVGPGTGLGVAQLLKVAGGYHVIETEAGHTDFAPLDALEDRILTHLRHSFGRVSVERIACGSGLANLYGAISAIEEQPASQSDDDALWTAALEGSDVLAIAALDRFFLSLGAIAGDLALAHGANAVVIGGGLGYRLKDRFATSGFADRFIAKGRFERRMEGIMVKLLNHPHPGLFGAAAAFAREFA
ncbi:MAG: ROK family protein [Sphingomicrobium sp.]